MKIQLVVTAVVALGLSASAALHAQQAAPATSSKATAIKADQAGRPGGPQGFSIILVLGDMQAATGQSNVPQAAQKALADMKDFLPYKGYRLLDAQWTLCCGRTPVGTRLRGADEHEYELELAATPIGSDNVNVRFVLTEAAADVAVRATASEQSLATLRARRAELAKSFPPTHPDLAALDTMIARREREIESAGRRPVRNGTQAKASGRRRIIDTSFRMDVGETVVVGTSRVQGDKALIALLTAVAQRGSAAR